MSRTWFGNELETVATFWRILRRDGVTLGFTTHDRDVWLDGVLQDGGHIQSRVTDLRVEPVALSGATTDMARLHITYADADGELPTCFLTNNDITGGNSGSAVLNARGELIGLAFDGNIESLSSDLRYNPQLQRCINADIRYILFVIDTYGGSHYLLNEMEIRR